MSKPVSRLALIICVLFCLSVLAEPTTMDQGSKIKTENNRSRTQIKKTRKKRQLEKRIQKEKHLPTVISAKGGKKKKAIPSDPSSKKKKKSDIKFFGEKVAFGVDRFIRKRSFTLFGDPWTLQGIPLVFYAPVRGLHLGIHFLINDIARQDPHEVSINGQVLATSGGRYRHFLNLDFPYAIRNRFRIRVRLAYNRDVTNYYFGIGNDTIVDNNLVDQHSILYQNVRTYPSVTLEVLRRFGRHFMVGPIFGFKWMDIGIPVGSLLQTQAPLGTAGGKTHYIGIAAVYETLDFEPYPSRGSSHELYFYTYPKFMGSEYEFFRAIYTYRKYWPLKRSLTLALRSFVEGLTGDVPFYELNVSGGSDPTLGFGADRFIRGFHSNQFIDRIRLISGIELRWDAINFVFAREKITLGIVPFFDIGRVWSRVFPLSLGNWHAATGLGVRAVWNHRFIIRMDFAVNKQQTGFLFELGHSF